MIPPYPPSYHPPLFSPKHAEFRASLGSVMARTVPVVPDFVPVGFVITNLTISGGTATLAWQNGSAPFSILGSSDLNLWSVIAGPVSNSPVTFNPGSNRYFRLLCADGLTNLITILDDNRFGTATTDVYWAGAWIDHVTFGSNDCAVGEGCCLPGDRKLLRFPVTIYNPSSNTFWSGPAGDYYFYDPCHHHFHITNFSQFTLLNESGTVAADRKMGWCVRSFGRLIDLGWNTNPPPSACTQPQLMPGWGDTYNLQDCMWFDVTGFPDGIYTMRIELDVTGQYGFRQRSEHGIVMIVEQVGPWP